MSLLPLLLSELLDSPRPSRILDQHFGLNLDPEDLLTAITVPRDARALLRNPAGYYRPWKSGAAAQDTGSTVSFDKDKFQVNLDVQQFAPEEITVKVTGENTITVEGKHEEKQDEHGFISRHFVRRYIVPKGHDVNQAVSSLSSDGVLTISAPRITDKQIEERSIPITQTGVPSKPIENKTKEQQEQQMNGDN